MVLAADQLEVVAELMRTAPTLPEAAASWRRCFPDVRVMCVDAVEMRDETPAFEFGRRRAYFASLRGACVSVTAHAREADMVIFTEAGSAHGHR